MQFTQRKFRSLPLPQQHARAAECCKKMLVGFSIHEKLFSHYLEIATWMELLPIEKKPASVQDRFYFHLERSQRGIAEGHMPWISVMDSPSDEPFLPVAIYLDRLRSAHNIGSIIRTTEALRCGYIHMSPGMASKEHPGVKKTAMQTEHLVPIVENAHIHALPRPLIVLETAPQACPIDAFTFPAPPFTLAVGNEELGCAPELLAHATHFIRIPLFGTKNSLNVAAAYAIAAQKVANALRGACKPPSYDL